MKANTSLGLILATVALALYASASAQQFTGSVTASDPIQTGRLFRDSNPSMAGMNKPFPGVTSPGSPFRYDSYVFVNPFAVSTAFTIQMSTTNVGNPPNNPFGVVYLGAFDPMNIATNYRADAGSSPTSTTGPVTFSFDIPAGAMFTFIINETLSGSADQGDPSNYSFTLSPAVPEPSTYAFLASGLGFALVRYRRCLRAASNNS
jgi:hypothetical protein